MKRQLGIALLTTGALVTLTACHSDKNQSPGGLRQNLPTASPTSSAAQASGVTMRVVNLYSRSGQPGPALDIYDVQLTGQKASPIVTGLAYGAVSDYFTPTTPPANGGQAVVSLYALPAGEDPTTEQDDAKGMGSLYDDGSHAQVTDVLTGPASPNGSDPLADMSFHQDVEKGDDGQGGKAPVAPPAPNGQGELLASTAGLPEGMNNSMFLMVDASCDPPINGDPDRPGVPQVFAAADSSIKSGFALFPTAAGSHQVSVVGWPTDGPAATCAALTQKQGQTSVDVTADQQVEVFIYGTSLTDLHLVAAPIKQ